MIQNYPVDCSHMLISEIHSHTESLLGEKNKVNLPTGNQIIY